jgi:16S rRNA (uracil1498-N3)-methyltransferase
LTVHRFYLSPEHLTDDLVALPEEVAHQVVRVLRLREGAGIALFCGDGSESRAVLEEVSPRRVTARIQGRVAPEVELPCELHVALAVLKGEKLDWVVQKLTELGASRISLTLTERTIVAAGEERWPKRLERYARIAREAAEQSGRVRVPAIDGPVPLAETLDDSRWFFLDPEAGESLAASLEPCPSRLGLLIGPEGGFTAEEREAALAAGAAGVTLGRRVLRAETAAIAAAALVSAAAENRRR